jgi:sugar lactone lactonase YvrE
VICSAVTLVSGQATCTTSALAIGAHSITAVYSGDAYNAPSTSGVLTQTVNAAVTVPGAPTIGIATAGDMQVTVTFTAPASDGGSAITTYTATSLPGGTTGTCAAPCTSITVSGLTDGVAYAFTVTATNSVGTGPASAPSNGVTPAAATTTTLGSAPDPSFFGQNVTFTASVNGSVPTGTVTFSDGATPLCTAVGLVSVKGLVSATCTTAALSIGGHPITAAYSGDANNAASTSGVLTQTVNAAATLPGAPTIGTATAGDGQATVMFAAPAANGSSPITSFTATSSPGNFTGACLPKCASITVTGLTDGVAYTFTVTAANSVGTGPASAASNSVTPSQPAPYIINTIAGGSIGDGAPATTAPFAFPDGAAVDANGNLYIADTSNNRIRMVAAATGIITTVAGSGNQGFSGDGGPASSASINGPSGMAVDANGNLYFADQGNERIRMIAAATGIISTVAGSGKGGFGGDGGAATSAILDQPQGVAVDANGNLFIADTNNNRIREVVAATGIITTVAGGGNAKGTFYGDGGAATQALLYFPTGVAFDTNENLYIADSGNNRIRIVAAATGIINTIAGGGKGTFSGDGGAATAASLNAPYGVAVDASDNLYIADSSNNRIRMVAASSGIITTIAGDGTASFSGDGGAATSASLDFPVALIIDASGNVYIVDQNNCAIRKVTSVTGIITTIAGNGSPGFFGDGAAATSSGLSFPNGVAADPSGNQFIADTLDNRIRRVAVATGIITTVAGNGTRGFSGDGGAATNATLSIPKALAVDANDNLYFSDGDFRVRMVASATGTITTVAGNGTPGFGGDGGAATAASLNGVTGVAVDANHNLYIADVGNSRIRMVAAATGIITTVVGNGTRGFSGDGGIATAASLGSPYAVALDANNNLYLADRDNSRIRMVAAATGIITTIAGNGTPGSCCDGGLATSAELYDPIGVAVDATGNLYIADAKLTRIREVAAATGIITTIAGNGTAGFSGDGGLAVNAEMEVPDGVAVDGSGNLFIADTSNNRIREVFIATQRPPASITAINGSGQSAAVNSAFAVNLQSIVKDSVGTPVQGASVTFTLPAAGASGTFGGQTTATVITGAGGIATAPALTANLIIGNWTATASVVGVATPATFALTNVAGPPAAIAASAGTPQATLTTTLFPSMLDATVTDAYGNPVSGASVMFNVPLAGASGTFPGNFKTVTLPTNAAGVAATPVTANGIAGAFTATAKVGAVAPANFALTSVLRAGTAILPLSGTPQTTTVGQPYAQTLQAKVTNGAGNPIPGLTVTFTLPAGAISGTFPGNVRTFTALTDALGEVTSPVITATNRAGTFIAHASVVGVAPASFSLTNAPGAPATITATVGGQMTAVYMQFARALAARVLDNLGNAVPGQTVTFMLPATNPNATFAGGGNPVTGITNAAGIATSPLLTANAIVGAYTATATLAGVAVPANFLLTNTVGANATATIVSGTPQSTTVLMPFGQTLQVVVHDALSRPIEGVNVTFTVLGGAAAAIFAPPNVRTVVVPTDATGLAATPLATATKIAGTYPVRATAAGIAGFLTFNLTNTPSAQTNAVSNGVGAQTAIVNQPYAKAPSVRVTDAYGNRVPNVSVTFTVPTMGATGTFAGSGSSFTIATDATGIATSPVVTANSTIGVWNVTSVVTGIVAPVNFGMRNLLDPSATITATSPPESTPKGTNFPQPLTAIVKDHLGNPITGVTVTFAMPSQALSAHFNPGNTFVMTAPTDSTGVASTVLKTIKATATPGTYSPTATIGVGAPATFSLTNQ